MRRTRSERRGELLPRCSGRRHSAAWLVWFCPVGVVLSGWFGTVGCVWLVRYGWLVTKEELGVPAAFRWNSDGTLKKARKKHSDLPLQASECFVPLLYVPAGGRGRSATNFELQTYSLVCSFTPPLVEARGIEPLSENLLIGLSPSAFGRLSSPEITPAERLDFRVTVLFMIG